VITGEYIAQKSMPVTENYAFVIDIVLLLVVGNVCIRQANSYFLLVRAGKFALVW
jgi:hypothetical protein